jgi:hypothetical protein
MQIPAGSYHHASGIKRGIAAGGTFFSFGARASHGDYRAEGAVIRFLTERSYHAPRQQRQKGHRGRIFCCFLGAAAPRVVLCYAPQEGPLLPRMFREKRGDATTV